MTEPVLAVPDGYSDLLEHLKSTVAADRWQAQRVVNTELLVADLRAAFPDMRGLSRRNFVYMCTFAAAYPNPTSQQAVAQLPWGHVTVLLDKLNDHPQRDWYTTAAVEYGWSRNVLTHHIATGLHGRVGCRTLELHRPATRRRQRARPPADPRPLRPGLPRPSPNPPPNASSRAPWSTGFRRSCSSSATASRSSAGNTTSRSTPTTATSTCCSSTGPSPASSSSNSRSAVASVDENLRDQSRHSPTIRILLCTFRNDNVVRHGLANSTAPLAVADYPYDTLSAADRNAVPAADQLIAIADTARRHLEPPSRYPSPDRAERAVPDTPTQT